jgi:hypothetical protein
VGDDVGRDSLAASDACGDELPGVSAVEAGARWADGGPAVLAGDDELGLDQLARDTVQGQATQADRLRAQARLIDLRQN